MTAAISTDTVSANGVEFTYLHAGPNDGSAPLALCLHGFPDSANTWRHLLPALADAGFHAVAPFMRGYAPTEIPDDGLYQAGALSADANALHDALGAGGDAVLVGHDWGAPAVYGAAGSAPQKWSKVVGMAVPPGGTMGAALLGNLDQLKRSWYFFFFQHGLSDMIVPANDLAFIDMIWDDWSPGFDATDDLAHVKSCLRDPAHLAAALGYYRATFGDAERSEELNAIEHAGGEELSQPTLYLHGRNDGCIGAEVAELGAQLCPWATVEIIDDAGHFLQLEQPDAVNARIVEHLTA